ncbi:ArsR/SmtB family transcription factor [Mesorhizobium sp. 43Arga]
MGSAHRLSILAYLLDEEMSVNVLGKKMKLSNASLSIYLGQLCRLGLVKARRDGVWICYTSR